MVTVDFDDGFNTKVCSVDHIIIIVYINGVSYRGVFQNVPNLGALVTLFKAFGILLSVDFDVGFNTKLCSFGHIIIVVYINGVGYMGSSEMSQIWVLW